MKRWSIGILALSLAGSLLPLRSDAQSGSQLTVQIENLKNQSGQVCLSLFSSSKGFPSDGSRAERSQCVKLSSRDPLQVTFPNLRPGTYAVAVLHDANADNRMNRNAFGIPTEGFGFSRNPAIVTGAPKFSEAAVIVAGPDTVLQIRMNYLFGG